MLALMVDCALIGTLAFLGLAVWRLGTIVERYALLELWGRTR